MLWLGFKGGQASSAVKADSVGQRGLLGTVAATFALTIVNPMTIVAFAAMFAGLGLTQRAGWADAMTVTLGVFIGSLLWWSALSGGVAFAKHRLPSGFSLAVSLLSGAILLLFGFYAIATAIISLLSGGLAS